MRLKFYLTAIIALLVAPPGFAETEAEALRKAFPWIYTGEDGFRYETISLDAIHEYCNKNEGEMTFWYEEYRKRVGEIADREPQNGKPRPEDGLMSGVKELFQLYVTFYINKRASDGWRVVGISGDFFVFEKRQGRENQAEQGSAGQPATRSESDSEDGDKPQPESEGRSR